MDAKLIKAVTPIFTLAAFGMFIYTTFFSGNDTLREQGIYWFVISLASALLPSITRLKFQDMEVEFKKDIQRVEKEVFQLKGMLHRAMEKVNTEESSLSPEELEQRNRYWDDYQGYMDTLSGDDKFQAQRENSLFYLREFGMEVREIKQHLKKLGYHPGNIDDEFSPELARSVEHFQRMNSMRHVDGMIGQLTLRQINLRLREQELDSGRGAARPTGYGEQDQES